jgi:hypothetical protein
VNYWVAALLVAIGALAAGLASHFIGRGISVELRRKHHDVGGPVFLQGGVMLSVLLAFVFSEVWGEYNTAAQAISSECSALHGAAILAADLPGNAGSGLRRSIARYAERVVHDEWRQMSSFNDSPAASADFRAMMRSAATLDLTRPVDVSDQSQILSLLAQAHEQREIRLFQVSEGLPTAIWLVLIGMSFALLLFVLFSGLEPGGHFLFSSAYAGFTVAILVLLRLLDYPFEGAMALSSASFAHLVTQVTQLAAGG